MNIGSYEALEANCLKRTDLREASGEFGLAVAYRGNAFRFAGRILDVSMVPEVQVVAMEVVSLDGAHTRDLTFETDPETGIVLRHSLQVQPISDVGDSKPLKACFFDPDIQAANHREKFTYGDRKRFRRLAESQGSVLSAVPVGWAAMAAGGRIESKKSKAQSEQKARTRRSVFRTVLANIASISPM